MENVTNKPRIITENVTAKPKVITQRITAEPKVIQENVEYPIKQLIINQPTQLTENYKAVPQFIRGSPKYINRNPVVQPVRYTQSQQVKRVNVAGNTVNNYTYIQPTSHTIREQVRIQQG